MSFFSLFGALELGLIFGLVALGVLISFRLLNFPDLTVDGSFTLGAATTATLIASGMPAIITSAIAILVGAAAGSLTAWLHVRLKIVDLLASILVMIALYSINLRIMGRPNVPLIFEPTLFSNINLFGIPDYMLRPAMLFVVVIIIKLLLDWFFTTQLGLAILASGANQRMASAQGIATGKMTIIGLAVSNALVAAAGSFYAQTQGGADISMGVGTIVAGLAAVIIGETLFHVRRLIALTAAVIFGAILYRLFVALALNSNVLGIQAQDLNLITAFIIVIALILPNLKKKILARSQQSHGQSNAEN